MNHWPVDEAALPQFVVKVLVVLRSSVRETSRAMLCAWVDSTATDADTPTPYAEKLKPASMDCVKADDWLDDTVVPSDVVALRVKDKAGSGAEATFNQ